MTVGGGEARISMLETVREFALDRLAEHGEQAEARDRHADWVLALTSRGQREFVVPDQRRWVERMEREHANVRAALAWLIEHGESEKALRLAGNMFVFWFLRGHQVEGAGWLDQTLARAPDAAPADSAWTLFGAGFLVWAQGDFARSEALARQGLAIAREHNLVFNVATCLFVLHDAVIMQDRLDEAIAIGEEALVRMRESGNRTWLAHVLCDFGTALSTAGDRERGARLVDEGLALHRELGNKQGAGNNLSDLGFDALDEGDTPAATRFFEESLQLLWESGDRWYLASPVTGIAVLAADAGRAAEAARLFGASKAIRERSGAPRWPAERAHVERAVATSRAVHGDEGYELEEAAGRSLRLAEVVAEASGVAIVLLTQGASAGATPPPEAGVLSPRELEVLQLLAAGHSNPAIAEALFVSRGTVRTHVSNILAKLDARSRTEAVAIAHRQGLI
jgi:non-specific serine/threonine protein kinase